MASVIKRGKSYSVVYRYTGNDGTTQQMWESGLTHAEAKQRKIELEYQLGNGSFLPPKEFTINELMRDYVELYGRKKWSEHTYDIVTSMNRNYISPHIGTRQVREITPRVVDQYYTMLEKIPMAKQKKVGPIRYIQGSKIKEIHKTLRSAFNQAIRWEYISRNPFDHTVLPKHTSEVRATWNAEQIEHALKSCHQPLLFIAMNIAFACTLRVGEICGLGWEFVDVSPEAIERDDAYLKVEQELTRISTASMNALAGRDIYRVFPPTIQKVDPKTCLVLKSPKTASSVRKVWIPRTVAMLLADWKREQEQLKAMLGPEYYDYGMVLALPNGKPVELKLLENYLGELIEREGLPPVVFHSLRHSSVTYKLKLNNGDIKLTQGDSGHAQAMMLLHVYSRILDEDRRVGAQKFDQTFYHRENSEKPRMDIEPQATEVLSKMLETISTKPEIASLLLKLFQAAS